MRAEMSTPKPSSRKTSCSKDLRYPASAQNRWMDGYFLKASHAARIPDFVSCILAAWTTTASRFPMVSTTMCRLCPFVFPSVDSPFFAGWGSFYVLRVNGFLLAEITAQWSPTGCRSNHSHTCVVHFSISCSHYTTSSPIGTSSKGVHSRAVRHRKKYQSDRQVDQRRCPDLSGRHGGNQGKIERDMAITKTHPIKSTLKWMRHGNVENCRSCRWKTHSRPMGKNKPFPQQRRTWQFTHIPTTPTTAKIYPIPSYPSWKEREKRTGAQPTISHHVNCAPVLCLEKCAKINF